MIDLTYIICLGTFIQGDCLNHILLLFYNNSIFSIESIEFRILFVRLQNFTARAEDNLSKRVLSQVLPPDLITHLAIEREHPRMDRKMSKQQSLIWLSSGTGRWVGEKNIEGHFMIAKEKAEEEEEEENNAASIQSQCN